jgi:flagellar M-ring protein FliF
LAPVVGGSDKVVAKVNLDIDFSKIKSHATIYSPDNVVRSEQTIEEEKTGYGEKKVGGVPGAVSNIGPVQGLKSNQIKNKYSKSETTTNYEISTTIKDTIAPLAKIKRVTAAVVVDGHYEKDKKGKIKFVPLSKIEIANITNLVKNVIGYNVNRGDSVSVSSFQFNNLNKKSTTETIMSKVEFYIGPISTILKYLILIVVLFIFYKKVIVPFSQKMLEVKPTEEESEKKKRILEIEEEEESTYDKIKELKEKVENQLGITSSVNEEELKYEVLLERITKMVEEKPQEVAKVLENLLKEEEKGI